MRLLICFSPLMGSTPSCLGEGLTLALCGSSQRKVWASPSQPASSPRTEGRHSCIGSGAAPLSFVFPTGWEEGGLERRPPGDF